jgi:uncharacterized protein YxjI
MRVIIPVSFGLLLSVPAAALTPSISSISPSPVPASNSDELITISGSNFQSGVTLTFHDTNGTAYPSVSSKLTFVSATEVTYELNDAIDSGTWTVYATNPGGLTSSTVNFNVAAAALTPSISSISPSPMPASNSDELITISGSNFQSGVTLTFHDTNGTAYPSVSSKLTFVSATEVTYKLNDAIDSGTWTVYATNPGGLTSSTVNFNVAAAALTQSGTILAGFDTNRQ